mgnify:CR=1 FL=1
MKYFFQSMLGAMLLLSGVFSFSSCGNDESDPDSTVTIAMATVEKQPQYDAPYLVLDNGEKLWVVQHLNLVVNEMIPWTKDGYAHLELRYNNNGSQGRLVPGMVSFKLDDYSPENSELKGIKVLVNPVDGEEKTYIFSYPLTGEDVPGFNPLDLAELK